jgi:hypothetical protein
MKEMNEMKGISAMKMEREGVKVAGWIVYWNYSSKRLLSESLKESPVDLKKYLLSQTPRDYFEDVLMELKKVSNTDLMWRVQQNEKGWIFHIGKVKIKGKLKVLPYAVEINNNRDVSIIDMPSSLAKKILKLNEMMRNTENASWIMTLVIKYIMKELMALRMRRDGGIYFIPAVYKDKLETLINFLSQLGYETYKIPVLDEQGTREAIWNILKEEVKEIEKEISSYIDDLNKGMRFNEKGFETRLENLKEYRKKLKTYTQFGEEAIKSLKNTLEKLEEEMVIIRLSRKKEVADV